MKISKNLINRIKTLANYHESLDSEVGLFECDNSGVIFSSLKPLERVELMNLFRPKDWFNSAKRINFRKIEKQCKQKIFEICNA